MTVQFYRPDQPTSAPCAAEGCSVIVSPRFSGHVLCRDHAPRLPRKRPTPQATALDQQAFADSMLAAKIIRVVPDAPG